MRIINLLDQEAQSIEAPLLAMASSANRLDAAKGKKLLEMVTYLHSQGGAHVAYATFALGELWLVQAKDPSRASVRIWIDWPDRVPLRDGLPPMHYRIQTEIAEAKLSRDTRAETLEEVSRTIFAAFGWTRAQE